MKSPSRIISWFELAIVVFLFAVGLGIWNLVEKTLARSNTLNQPKLESFHVRLKIPDLERSLIAASNHLAHLTLKVDDMILEQILADPVDMKLRFDSPALFQILSQKPHLRLSRLQETAQAWLAVTANTRLTGLLETNLSRLQEHNNELLRKAASKSNSTNREEALLQFQLSSCAAELQEVAKSLVGVRAAGLMARSQLYALTNTWTGSWDLAGALASLDWTDPAWETARARILADRKAASIINQLHARIAYQGQELSSLATKASAARVKALHEFHQAEHIWVRQQKWGTLCHSTIWFAAFVAVFALAGSLLKSKFVVQYNSFLVLGLGGGLVFIFYAYGSFEIIGAASLAMLALFCLLAISAGLRSGADAQNNS